MKSEKQKLIDITFELVMIAHGWKDFKNKSREEIGDWVSKNLKAAGFFTHPLGMSWGVLIEDPELIKKFEKDDNTESKNK